MGRTRDLLDETILTIPLNHAVQAMRQMRAAYMLTVYYTKSLESPAISAVTVYLLSDEKLLDIL